MKGLVLAALAAVLLYLPQPSAAQGVPQTERCQTAPTPCPWGFATPSDTAAAIGLETLRQREDHGVFRREGGVNITVEDGANIQLGGQATTIGNFNNVVGEGNTLTIDLQKVGESALRAEINRCGENCTNNAGRGN